MRYALSQFHAAEEKEQASRKNAAAAVLRKLDRNHDEDAPDAGGKSRRVRKEDIQLTQYEQMIAMDVVAPEDIPVAFDG